jgi:hypothetical protein
LKRTRYNVAVETSDGHRYAWDSGEYQTIERAAAALTLDHVRQQEPRASKIIVVEVTERDVLTVEHEIDGELA